MIIYPGFHWSMNNVTLNFQVIIPARTVPQPMRITCRYVKKDALLYPPPLNEGEGQFISNLWGMGGGKARGIIQDPLGIFFIKLLIKIQ